MSYDGLQWDDLPDDMKETLANQAATEAEEKDLQEQYGGLMHIAELVGARNKAVMEGNLTAYDEYTRLLADENIGDC